MPEDYEKWVKELERQLKPINDAITKIMHPETGFYPQIKEARDTAKRAHERIDDNSKYISKLKTVIFGENNTDGLQDFAKENRRLIDELNKHRKRVVRTLLWLGTTTGTPIIGGIGYLIWKWISGG